MLEAYGCQIGLQIIPKDTRLLLISLMLSKKYQIRYQYVNKPKTIGTYTHLATLSEFILFTCGGHPEGQVEFRVVVVVVVLLL